MIMDRGDADSVERRAANYFVALSAVPPLLLAWVSSPLFCNERWENMQHSLAFTTCSDQIYLGHFHQLQHYPLSPIE
ncbi:MAG TPA: hypothetical protein V6D14_17090 [Coleofasciculaceae cyanobacterium]